MINLDFIANHFEGKSIYCLWYELLITSSNFMKFLLGLKLLIICNII